jgi:bacterioferritin
MNKSFLTDIKRLRRRARSHLEEAPSRKAIALTARPCCGCSTRRSRRSSCVFCATSATTTKRHYYMAAGIHGQAVAAEFLEHADEGQGHTDLIAERLLQLGGAPDLNPDSLLSRSHSEYVEGEDLYDPRGSGGRAGRRRLLPRDDRVPGR